MGDQLGVCKKSTLGDFSLWVLYRPCYMTLNYLSRYVFGEKVRDILKI